MRDTGKKNEAPDILMTERWNKERIVYWMTQLYDAGYVGERDELSSYLSGIVDYPTLSEDYVRTAVRLCRAGYVEHTLHPHESLFYHIENATSLQINLAVVLCDNGYVEHSYAPHGQLFTTLQGSRFDMSSKQLTWALQLCTVGYVSRAKHPHARLLHDLESVTNEQVEWMLRLIEAGYRDSSDGHHIKLLRECAVPSLKPWTLLSRRTHQQILEWAEQLIEAGYVESTSGPHLNLICHLRHWVSTEGKRGAANYVDLAIKLCNAGYTESLTGTHLNMCSSIANRKLTANHVERIVHLISIGYKEEPHEDLLNMSLARVQGEIDRIELASSRMGS